MMSQLHSQLSRRSTAHRISVIAGVFFLFLAPRICSAQDTNVTSEAGHDQFETPFPSGGDLRMYIRSSGVRITGSDENKIVIHFSAPGRDSLNNVHVKLKQNGNRGDLDITGGPSNNFQIDITIPRQSNLYVRMFAGQLEIAHVDGNKDLQIHAGEMDITLPNPSDYGPVDTSVTTGDIEARAFGVSKGGFFRSFRTNTALHKNAAGKYSLYAHVGAGELDIN
ncbi:MAG: hypothetical protein WA020_07035 [Candidatus Acidiferrales bacterium]